MFFFVFGGKLFIAISNAKTMRNSNNSRIILSGVSEDTKYL